MSINVPISRLKKICNPFDSSPWATSVSLDEVRLAIKNCDFVEPRDSQNTEDHAGRIALLVVKGWDDPIDIDVGCPILSYWPDWIIQDGNHRTAAAIYLKKRYIKASVAGQMDYAKKLLGVDCCED